MCLIIKLPIHKNNIPVNFGIVNYRTACIVRLSHWATPSKPLGYPKQATGLSQATHKQTLQFSIYTVKGYCCAIVSVSNKHSNSVFILLRGTAVLQSQSQTNTPILYLYC